jgi:hypothetical protein
MSHRIVAWHGTFGTLTRLNAQRVLTVSGCTGPVTAWSDTVKHGGTMPLEARARMPSTDHPQDAYPAFDDAAEPQLTIYDVAKDSLPTEGLAAALLRKGAWVQGLLHADPDPEAFRYDAASGICGIIDWSSAHYGPLLYDLASAVMYLGGPDRAAAMTDAYQSAGLLTSRELADGLPAMLRFRWASPSAGARPSDPKQDSGRPGPPVVVR